MRVVRPGSGTNRLSRAFVGLAAVVYGLLVFGASVRVHGAGLACPDWPLCFGELVPRLNFAIFLEWGHRVLASLVSFGFLFAGVMVLRTRATRERAGKLVGLAAFVLAIQVVLGGLTVLHLLAFWSVTLHLLTGNLFLVLLLLIARRLGAGLGLRPAAGTLPSSARWVAGAFAGALVVQMALGGLVSSNYAGLACTDWPSCLDGRWFPVGDGGVALQIAHRLGAYSLLGLAVGFWAVVRSNDGLRAPASVLLLAVLSQAALGVANVLLRLPVEVAIAHSSLADLIVVITLVTVSRVFELPKTQRVSRRLPMTAAERA